jgi:hypothetical protein
LIDGSNDWLVRKKSFCFVHGLFNNEATGQESHKRPGHKKTAGWRFICTAILVEAASTTFIG